MAVLGGGKGAKALSDARRNPVKLQEGPDAKETA